MPKTKRSAPVRQLRDLVSIGPAMLRDLGLLRISTVPQLARQDPRKLYEKLSRLTGHRQDPCVLDTFTCAVAQAKDPSLPAAKKKWWYWSRVRLSRSSKNIP